jgi:hypothetical protein
MVNTKCLDLVSFINSCHTLISYNTSPLKGDLGVVTGKTHNQSKKLFKFYFVVIKILLYICTVQIVTCHRLDYLLTTPKGGTNCSKRATKFFEIWTVE